MSKDGETKIVAPVMQDTRKQLTEQDLLLDAAKVVQQLEQFYLPGEVEATVLLSFRGVLKGHVAVSTSVDSAERLRWQIECARCDIPRMSLLVKNRKLVT